MSDNSPTGMARLSRRAFLVRGGAMLGVIGFGWPLAGLSGLGRDSTESSWLASTQNLARALPGFKAGQHLIIEDGASGYYVQFTFLSGGLRAEAVSNNYLPDHRKLTHSAILAMGALGWQMPASRQTATGIQSGYSRSNFYRYFLWSGPPYKPVPFEQVAGFVMKSLQDIYSVEHPDRLRYVSFQGNAGRRSIFPGWGSGEKNIKPSSCSEERVTKRCDLDEVLRYLG